MMITPQAAALPAGPGEAVASEAGVVDFAGLILQAVAADAARTAGGAARPAAVPQPPADEAAGVSNDHADAGAAQLLNAALPLPLAVPPAMSVADPAACPPSSAAPLGARAGEITASAPGRRPAGLAEAAVGAAGGPVETSAASEETGSGRTGPGIGGPPLPPAPLPGHAADGMAGGNARPATGAAPETAGPAAMDPHEPRLAVDAGAAAADIVEARGSLTGMPPTEEHRLGRGAAGGEAAVSARSVAAVAAATPDALETQAQLDDAPLPSAARARAGRHTKPQGGPLLPGQAPGSAPIPTPGAESSVAVSQPAPAPAAAANRARARQDFGNDGALGPDAATALAGPAGGTTAPIDAGGGRSFGGEGSGQVDSAPAGAAAAPAQPAPDAVPAARQLAIAIIRHAGGETERLTVALRPEELGSVEVSLELADDGLMRAHFVAERAETLDLLRRDAAELERSLRAAGVELSGGGMSFTMRDQGGSHERDRRLPSPAASAETDAFAVRRPAPAQLRAAGHRLLDLSV